MTPFRLLLALFLPCLVLSVKPDGAARLAREVASRPIPLPVQTFFQLISPLLSPLQQCAIRASTAVQYYGALSEFVSWMIATQVSIRGPLDLDATLVIFFDALARESAPSDVGRKTMAAVLHLVPTLGSTLRLAFPAASRAALGWEKLCPPSRRRPPPLLAILAVVGVGLSEGRVAMCLALLLGMSCYLRPRELTGLLTSQLIPPQAYGGRHFSQWAILLHPRALGQPSKTGAFDESLPLDSTWLQWMEPFLLMLVSGRDQASRLWPFTHEELVRFVLSASHRLGLPLHMVCLYGLRHGGASEDWLRKHRELLSIKCRGRWTSDAGLRRYQKASAAQAALANMPSSAQ